MSLAVPRRSVLVALVWFLCHPGTLATFEGREFFIKRYPLRHVLVDSAVAVETREQQGTNKSSLKARGLKKALGRTSFAKAVRALAVTGAKSGKNNCGMAFVAPAILGRPRQFDRAGNLRVANAARFPSKIAAASCPCLQSLGRGADHGPAKPQRRRTSTRMLFGRGGGGLGGGGGGGSQTKLNQSNFSKSASISDFAAATPATTTTAATAATAYLDGSPAYHGQPPAFFGGAARDQNGFTALMHGAASALDDAVSFVECKLVTSGLGRALLEPHSGRRSSRGHVSIATPASLQRAGLAAAADVSMYDLVGYADVNLGAAAHRSRVW